MNIKEMLKLFKQGNDMIRVITSDKDEIKVNDYLLIEGKITLEEYSTFNKNELIASIDLNSDEEIQNQIIDYLSTLKMWVIDLEEDSDLIGIDEIEILENFKDKKIENLHPDILLWDYVNGSKLNCSII